MVSQETLEVVLRMRDELTQKVREVDQKINQLGNTSKQAMDKSRTATSQASNELNQQSSKIEQLRNKYNNLKSTVTNAFNGIKNAIKNSSVGQAISESALAQPFLNAAEKIRQKWSSMSQYLKSKIKPSVDTSGVNTAEQKIDELRRKVQLINQSKATPRFDLSTMKTADGQIRVVIKDLQNLKNNSVINLKANDNGKSLNSSVQMMDKILDRSKKINNTKITPQISPAGLQTLNGEVSKSNQIFAQLRGSAGPLGNILASAFARGSNAVNTFKTKLQNTGAKITNLVSGISGVQGILMSAFATVGVTSLKSFTIEAAIAREKVNAVTKSIAGSQQAFTATQNSIKQAIAGTTLGYNNMATAVNNVALRFHMSGESLKALPGPMAKVGIMAQAMGKSSSEAASIMEHAFDGLQGKWRSLKQIGISEADLKAAGWSGAAEDVNGYAAALDKVLERNPKFKEFTNTFEYQFESLKMSVKGVGTEIGMVILPVLKGVLQWITDLSKNNPELFKMGVTLGVILLALTSFATAVLPIIMLISAIKDLKIVMTAWNIVTKAVSIAQAALNLIMSANPIVIVVLAIIALIAILWYLYNTNEDVRNALNGLFEFLQNSFAGAWEWLTGVISGAGDAINGFMEWLGLLYQKFVEVLPLIMAILMPWSILFDENIRNVAIQAVQSFVSWISQLPSMVMMWLNDLYLKFLAWAGLMILYFKTTAQNMVTGFINWIMTLPAKLWTWLNNTYLKVLAWSGIIILAIKTVAQNMVDGFKNKIMSLPQTMWDELVRIKDKINAGIGMLVDAIKGLGQRMLDGFKSVLGINSPGFMFYAVDGEMNYIQGTLENAQSTLSDGAKNLGASILEGFNSNDFSTMKIDTNQLLTGGTSNTTTPILNSGDKGLGASADMDVSINPQVSMNTTAIAENITAMAELVNPQLATVTNSINTLGFTSSTNTTMILANNEQVKLSYQQLQLSLSLALQNINTQNTNAWTNIKQTTINNLNSILTSTKNVTTQMIQAWQTMKNSIVQAANDIKSQSEQRFNSLWNTIKTFYNRIQHPGGAGSPAMSTRRRGTGGHSAFKSFANSVQNRLGGVNGSVNRQTLRNKGFQPAEIEYLIPRSNGRVKTSSIFNYIENLTRAGAGGWSSAVKPNVDWIRNTTNKWKTAPPTIVRYKTSHGFEVGDFEHGEPRISFNEFRQIAEDVFSQCHYLFYMDSSHYGHWIPAARAGWMNCDDSTEFLLAMARSFGFSGTKVHGYWNNIGHYWANIAGHKMDTTGWMNRRTWTPSASHSGPVPRGLKLSEENDNQIVIIELLQMIYNLLVGSDENNTMKVIHEGKVDYKFKHEIEGTLPDGLTAEDVVSIMNAHVEDSKFIRLLTGNREFMDKFERMYNKIRGEHERFS